MSVTRIKIFCNFLLSILNNKPGSSEPGYRCTCYSSCNMSELMSTDVLFLVLIIQIGAVYIWSYVYPVMRLSANKGTKESETDVSAIQDNVSEETSHLYSEISTEALLPSMASPSSEEYQDQVEEPKVSSSMLLCFPS